MVVVTVKLLILAYLRIRVAAIRKYITKHTSVLVCLICTPLCIVLFFAAGRVTMMPQTRGVVEMPKFGCCSQGLAYPRERISDVVGMLEAAGSGYMDMLLETYANSRAETRWAVVPSVLQHVGSKSSKPSGATITGG